MYAALRIFYMDETMVLRSYLLALKLFRPSSAHGSHSGEVVMKWVRQVLAQHGLRPEDFAGAVSDAGADVKTGVGRYFSREWCIPHMMNRGTIDALGMADKVRHSKNVECRKLVHEVKKVVEHANRSHKFEVFSITCFIFHVI